MVEDYQPAFIRVAEVVEIHGRGMVLIGEKPLPPGTYKPGESIRSGNKVARILGIESNLMPNPPQQGFLTNLEPGEAAVGSLWHRALPPNNEQLRED